MPWHNVLAPEVRPRAGGAPTRVYLHLREPCPPHDVACESPHQAYRVQHAVHLHLAAQLRTRLLDSQLSGGAIEDAGLPSESVRSW